MIVFGVNQDNHQIRVRTWLRRAGWSVLQAPSLIDREIAYLNHSQRQYLPSVTLSVLSEHIIPRSDRGMNRPLVEYLQSG
jgi:hypothetical protein